MQSSPPSLIDQELVKRLSAASTVAEEDLREQYRQAVAKGIGLKDHLVKAKIVDAALYQRVASQIVGIEYISKINELPQEPRERFADAVPIRFAKKYLFAPHRLSEESLVFAVSSAWPSTPYEEAAEALGFDSFTLALTTEEVILETLNRIYDRNTGSAEEAAEILEEDEELNYLSEFSTDEAEDLLDAEDEEPIKKLMNSILFQSVKDGSSDIHIDPSPQETAVRNRIDGILHQITKVPKQGHIPLINRVKVMAGLDISTKNQTQDGRTMILMAGKKIDIRVSVIPTVYGERAVLRLLNQSKGIISLEDLGMTPEIAGETEKLVCQSHGIILVTGPTGSGKTTTLYSALNRIDAEEKNIVTIEDPVEYRIAGYGQMQTNEKVGVTFSKGLRAMLRQDPDVIMVGEMRDAETAQIAIQASLTGHLVLSTLHTNDAISTVIRLIDMEIEPFLVTSTLNAVIAQRLVRKICPRCKIEFSIGWGELSRYGIHRFVDESEFSGKLWKGTGCAECLNTGYRGRIGVYELLAVNDAVRQAILKSRNTTELKNVARQQGMKELGYDCAAKVIDGITTIDEMLRTIYSDSSSAAPANRNRSKEGEYAP